MALGNENKDDADHGRVVGKGVTTNEMPELKNADIEFTYAPPTWTKGNVTVTIEDTKASAHTGLHLEYAECTNGEMPSAERDWHDLNGNHQVEATKNENIFVRLSDDTNHKGYCSRKGG